jgi:hypothetical protein
MIPSSKSNGRLRGMATIIAGLLAIGTIALQAASVFEASGAELPTGQ